MPTSKGLGVKSRQGGGSAVSTGCSSEVLSLISIYPQGGSQLSVTPVPGDPMASSGLCTDIRAVKTCIRIK